MSRILYFDCFAGAAGDMILGALLDAGLPLEQLRAALGSLTLERYEVAAERVLRAGVSATKFRLLDVTGTAADGGGHHGTDREEPAPAAHGPSQTSDRHSHSHVAQTDGHAPAAHSHARPQIHPEHRSLREIDGLIERSALSSAGKTAARAMFHRLGEAEAAIHAVPIASVHLHEVGALDSIVDIVGCAFGVEWFGADRIVASPLNVGGGTVECAHGTLPVPAPATARLLQGVPVYSTGADGETVTPTGALVVTAFASAFGPIPPMRIERIGYGAGDRNPAHRPNVLRVLIGDEEARSTTEQVSLIECEIDDMNPQIFGVVMDALYAEGALEVFFASVQMKKNRPGTLVTIIAPPAARERLSAVLFRETTTIGVRYHEMHRERLERESVPVETPLGPIRFKLARRAGQIVNASAEFDDCLRVARERGLPIKEVQAIATKAYLDRRP